MTQKLLECLASSLDFQQTGGHFDIRDSLFDDYLAHYITTTYDDQPRHPFSPICQHYHIALGKAPSLSVQRRANVRSFILLTLSTPPSSRLSDDRGPSSSCTAGHLRLLTSTTTLLSSSIETPSLLFVPYHSPRSR